MSYIPGRCWANQDLADFLCPLTVKTPQASANIVHCPGGWECEHRGNADRNQCPNREDPESNSIGLCGQCLTRIVNSSNA